MSIKPPPGLTEDDFETIEDAVMETARGRWFLREFARRARAADTGRLLEALTRIERIVSGQSALPGGFDVEPHACALEERQHRFTEIAWTLRERGYDGSICSMIETEARALARIAEGVRGAGPLMEGRAASLPAPIPRSLAAACVEPPAVVQPAIAPRSSPVAPPPITPTRPTRDRRLDALAGIDRLPAREKAALFS